MAIEAVVSVVIQKLTHLLIQESNVFNTVIEEVECMRIELREMQTILKDAEHQEGSNETLSGWVADFLRIVYQVEYAIEIFALGTIRLRRMGLIKKYGVIMKNEFANYRKETRISYTSNIARLKKEMENIRKKLDDSRRNKPQFVPEGSHKRSSSEDEVQPPTQRWPETDSYYAEEEEEKNSKFVFSKDEKTLVNQLTNNNQPLQILSILGERGSGKTTVAKTIYNKTKSHFDFNAWVTIPRVQVPPARSLFLVILRQITQITPPQLKNVEKLEDDALRNRLHEFLKTNKYLIVIDDIKTGKCFQELRAVFPNKYNGSRVVFTTSEEDIASFADPWRRYNFKPLDTDDSWKLFLKKVPSLKGNPFPHHVMLDLKEEIIEICKGLPLRIMMLAGLLSARRVSSDEWWKVLEQQSSELPRSIGDLGPCSDILTFCYNDLPLHLKPCFLYLGLFPKGFEIPVRRLFRLWLAEGFVKRSPGMIPEDLVEGYLEELVNRNMVEISKRRSDESPKRCRMLGILHEVFLSKAVQIGLFHIHRNSNSNSEAAPQFGVRRLVEYADIKDSLTCNQDIRSYISFNHRKKDMPAEEVGIFLGRIIGTRGFGLLRVLDLERVYKPRLPENLGNLFYLRYLGLRWTFLDILPSSVGDLSYLETLDIKHTYISTLPSSVWRMKHLRHLCLNEAQLDMSVRRPHRSSLTQLQTLWGLYVDGKSSSKAGLNRLINLRKLGLTSLSTSFQELSTWISMLASLQSLRLRSKDKMGRPSELILKPFSSLENLSQLYLLGTLINQPSWYQFPPGLKVLTLSLSKLKEDPMPTLAQLPSLVVLRLLATSYTGKEMDCPSQGFPVLRVLKLWKLNELEKWTVQEGAMKNLYSLEIRCCSMLEELPENLLQLRTFKKLILTNMPKKFVTDMRRKRQKHTDVVENNWE